MATAAAYRSLLDELELLTPQGQNLPRVVGRALNQAGYTVSEERHLRSQSSRYSVVRQAYENWRKSLADFSPSTEQLNSFLQRRFRTLEILQEIGDAALRIEALGDSDSYAKSMNSSFEAELQTIERAIHSLIALFNETRPNIASQTPPAQAQSIFSEFSTVMSAEPESSVPASASRPTLPGISDSSSQSYSITSRPIDGQITNTSIASTEPKKHFKKLEHDDRTFSINGSYYGTAEDMAKDNSGPMVFDEVNIRGHAFVVNGNVVGSPPVRSPAPRHPWF